MAAGKTYWLSEVANILREAYPKAKKLPKSEMPNFMVKLVALFDDRVKSVLPDLRIFHEADAAYVTSLTGVVPRPSKVAILATVESLIQNGDISID
jgi:hypothetical protein